MEVEEAIQGGLPMLTKFMEKLENQLKDKKAKLAPQIKQLRAYR